MLDSIDEETFREWWAYDAFIEPLDIVPHMIANAATGICMALGNDEITPDKFFPRLQEDDGEDPQQQTAEEMKAGWRVIAAGFNAFNS